LGEIHQIVRNGEIDQNENNCVIKIYVPSGGRKKGAVMVCFALPNEKRTEKYASLLKLPLGVQLVYKKHKEWGYSAANKK